MPFTTAAKRLNRMKKRTKVQLDNWSMKMIAECAIKDKLTYKDTALKFRVKVPLVYRIVSKYK